MKLRLIIGLCFWLLLLDSQASELTVCQGCTLNSIRSAVEAAQAGDTIRVQPGIYDCENLAITKPLILLGEQRPTLDGGGKSYVLKLLADSIRVSGFSIINSGRSYTKDYSALYVSGSKGSQITDNHISQSFFGILVEKSREIKIAENKVVGTATREDQSGNGIHLWHCKKASISRNEVLGMRDGVYLEFVDSSSVADNYTHHNVRYGLHFMFSNHDEYSLNTFESNGAGVAVMFSKWIVMRENHFIENWGTASYGLLLKEIYDGEVIGNRFEENTLGIFIDGSSRINYRLNTFIQNGWAIKVSGGCYANHFSSNNFLGNSFDISYNSKMNDNTFNGNFWSEYSGYDLDQNGQGDVPYRPVKLFSYVVNKTPETIVLLRSLFVDLINFSEKVSPAFTPDDLVDHSPSMNKHK
ncbi:nitrous oxide reductase family maturation protein NosD [Reichenbachiella ulvae]|uniref:Nitrous oxide reductase family maturation protein NosD n=1 Tax=Reichenbachiella ulvae TaxID=2980104 RepID=A0ABT3CWI1_9BACT|nr:nitrous oxide reductase family maturation protein NosD [Reichenbachiella ulvae]MCV9387879.1 nitrous oxide reductase family maturation protein NosD [Reichenbachiella ulvae]